MPRRPSSGTASSDEAGLLTEPLSHPAFRRASEAKGVRSLYGVALSDGHRLGLLLQLSCALAHAQLRQYTVAGLADRKPFEVAFLDERNVLGGLVLEPGAGAVATQTALRRMALALFDADQQIAGRGQARRALRRLLDVWEEPLMEQPAAAQVRRILRVAPFLWDRNYRRHREALVAVHRRGGQDEERAGEGGDFPWVVGGPAFRERVLARTDEPRLLTLLVCSDEARGLWRGRSLDTASKAALSPQDLVGLGLWAGALARWRRQPPQTPLERLACAECLYSLGQFGEAAELARGAKGISWNLMRLKSAFQLGRLKSASRELAPLLKRQADWPQFSLEQRLDLFEVAIRVRANLGDWRGVKDWVQRALRWRGSAEARGRILAAEGSWDLQNLDAVQHHLECAMKLDAEIVEDWRYQRILGLFFISKEMAHEGRLAQETAMTLGRRSMRIFEAGREWSSIVLGRALDGDLAGAERACRHALRLLRQCDGPTRTTLTMTNFAEIRIRRGRFNGVQRILERATTENQLSSNQRGKVLDLGLQGRFLMASGRLVEAERTLRQCLDALGRVDRDGNVQAEHQLLLARCLGWLGRPKAARRCLVGATGGDHKIHLEMVPRSILEPEELPALFWLAGESRLAVESASGSLACLWRSVLADADRPGAGGFRIDPGEEGNETENTSAGSKALGTKEWKKACQGLEPYRAARLVFDFLLCGAVIEEEVVQMASDDLGKAGAVGLADTLAGVLAGSWKATAQYLAADQQTEEILRGLFFATGNSGVRIEVEINGESRTVLVGPGGEHCFEVHRGSHVWSFHLARLDQRTEAVALLVAHTWRGLDGDTGRALDEGLPDGVIGASSLLKKAYSDLGRLASSEMPLLILGETGTGKESAARSVHDQSRRAKGPFLPVNCAAFDPNLALSDLFGHVKGAFTGADKDRTGVFEAAAGGTVFLDEVGDLSMRAQGLLLRVLQEKEVRRVGESRPRVVDVRVVAATHRDLEEQVVKSEFREDLLYRLNTGVVTLPPLRDRGLDVLLLAEHFRKEFAERELVFSEAAYGALKACSWNGNIRQLRNQVQRACALAEAGTIEVENLGLEAPDRTLTGWHEWLEQVKRERLKAELERHDGNQSAAARSLGLTRQALSYLVRQLELQ